MANTERSGYCKMCEAQRKVTRPKANHVLHLILTIITLGVWGFIWLGVAVQFGGWRCDTCGSTKVARVG